VSQVAKELYERHDAMFVVTHALAGEYNNVPQMLILQYYKSISRSKIARFILPSYLKDLVAICIRIYYNLTYQYTKSQVDTTEQQVKAEANQNQGIGMEVDLNGSLLKALVQWKYAVSFLQGISFVKRFQITNAQKQEYQQNQMSEPEALNSLDRKLDELNNLWAVFCKKPLEPDQANPWIWLEGMRQWFIKTLLWQVIDWILTLPMELYKVFINASRALISRYGFDRNIFGKKKFRVMFIIYGFNPDHAEAKKLLQQFDNIVANPNALVLLVHSGRA